MRYRILKSGIKCIPWKLWKGEIELLPISSQTLFRKNGVPIDLMEIYLKSEKYLLDEECLLELLKDENCLKRVSGIDNCEDVDFGLMPDDFTEEDFLYWNKS